MKHLLTALLFCAAAPPCAADTFTFSYQPGPDGVGVKVVQQYDYTRQYKLRVDMTTGAPDPGAGLVSGAGGTRAALLLW